MSSQWLVKCVVLGVSLSNWATEMSDNNSHCYRKYSPRQYHFDQHTHENIYQNSWFLSVTKHFSWSLPVCSLPEDTAFDNYWNQSKAIQITKGHVSRVYSTSVYWQHYLARQMITPICPFVFHIYSLNWPSTLICCKCMVHSSHSSPGIKSKGHRPRVSKW